MDETSDDPLKAWPPTRDAALARMEAFVPRAGQAYARGRNRDHGPGAHTAVSGLSPYLRYRLVLEDEVLQAVLPAHGAAAAEKFVREVFWRTYFKGYLERRPSIWTAYVRERDALLARLPHAAELSASLDAAESGATGIDAFDHWAREIATTGYLHNHARMWFASIWMFTLRLPWQLGADFFLRHLLDGDPASNTLSWRWVAGLHTKGRTYLARRDNIVRNTGGRFAAAGLATAAPPLTEEDYHPLRPVPAPGDEPKEGAVWLMTEEDCADDGLLAAPAAIVTLVLPERRSPRPVSEAVTAFAQAAVGDAARRRAARTGSRPVTRLNGVDHETLGEALIRAAEAAGAREIVTHYVPQGPVRDALAPVRATLEAKGVAFTEVMRPSDSRAWVHASAGFFKMRKAIPSLLPSTGRSST